MKKRYAVIFILAAACSKHLPVDNNSKERPPSSYGEEYKILKRAEAYALSQWKGDATVGKDTFYFTNIFEMLPLPDSTTYRRTVLDKKVLNAFRYIFGPVKSYKEFWLSKWLHITIDFENNNAITQLKFSYSLDASMFYFQ